MAPSVLISCIIFSPRERLNSLAFYPLFAGRWRGILPPCCDFDTPDIVNSDHIEAICEGSYFKRNPTGNIVLRIHYLST